MALQFSNTFSNLVFKQALVRKFTTPYWFCIAIYQGARPTADNVANNWATYNTTGTTLLSWCAFQGQSYFTHLTATNTLTTSISLPSATPLRAGTATWAAIMCSSTNQWSTLMNSPTISAANNQGGIITCDVTDITGNGVIRLNDVNVNPANGPLTIADFGITIG